MSGFGLCVPAQAGTQSGRSGWAPAFAGERVQND